MTSTAAVESSIDTVAPQICSGQGCIIAVSGGVDSVALAHAVTRRLGAGMKPLIAHFDHRTRSRREHEQDQQTVLDLGRALGTPVVTGSASESPFLRGGSGGPESSARDRRYHFLGALSRSCGRNIVLTAHTRDDQIETVVMRLLAGIDSTLLRGIARIQQLDHLTVVRPFLELPKEVIAEYANESGLCWSEDRTNRSNEFRRNYVRNLLLPSARSQWPSFDHDVMRLQRLFALRAAESDSLAAAIHAQVQGDRVTIDAVSFFSSTREARLQFLYDALRRIGALSRDDRPSHRFFAPLLGERPNKSGTLLQGRGIRASILGDAVVVKRLLSALRNEGIFEGQRKETERKGNA